MADTTGTQYTLTFANNSTNDWTACVFQTDPGLQATTNAMSLAWFTKPTAKTTGTDFTWTIDYSFVWSETGTLIPGVLFKAAQKWPADLQTSNKVNFTRLDSGAYTFANQTAQAPSGSLIIAEDPKKIPVAGASVGIGMSNAGTFAVPSQPNVTLTFTPTPLYWITFGTFKQGQVLSISEMTAAAAVQFPAAVYAMTAILDQGNNWTVLPTSQVNSRFIADTQAALQSGDQERVAAVKWGDLDARR